MIDFKRFRKAAVYFAIASFAILLLTPRGGKFKYEFNVGKTWTENDLLAPFDFPVYKTEAELLEERKRTSEQAPSYFVMDTLQGVEQAYKLRSALAGKASGEALLKRISKPLDEIYKRGLAPSGTIPNERNRTIIILRGGLSHATLVAELFTEKSAYDRLKAAILNDSHSQELMEYADSAELNTYLVPNLSYDEDLTSTIKRNSLDAILPTEGMISEGSVIITKGETVSGETFKALSSLKREYEKNTGLSGNQFLMFAGRFFFILICMGGILALLLMFMRSMLLDGRCLVFTLSLIAIFAGIALIVLRVSPSWVYAVPFTIVPIYISSFFYSRPAIFIHFILILMTGYFTPSSFEFVFLNSVAGITAVIGFKHSYDRGQLFVTGLFIFLTYLISYSALKLLQEGSFRSFDMMYALYFVLNTFMVIVLFQFTFLFEHVFGFVSRSRLVELSDTNRRLLRELAEVAPGTAQHVMQVANLSEAVIREIGGDPLLVRAGALYHDIGKMKNPELFIENQMHGHNPHSNLAPEISAQIIIEHVTYGVELAAKHNLPEAIIDFIRTHHGRSKVFYFYSRYLDEHPEAKDDERLAQMFTYPGPNPSTKEMAVVMMADSCEAASRSLRKPDELSINTLVDKIIDTQLNEGYLKDSDVTLRDIERAKEVIKAKLRNIYHVRVEYPNR
ncbi:MAG: HDIG domain-containing protein [Prevotellaceae bacterium]|jgi:putative nucleotidyltransferase with HDIG domain|nr:HDIG domain-containing protein [Prevotellaceae bacterium]